MRTSEKIELLAAAIVKAQGAIKPAVKDATNPHFKSKYADLSAVWEAVRGALTQNALAIVQLPTHSEDNRAHLTTRIVHSSGQWLEDEASIPVAKQDAHGYGSAITYLRRYGLSALLGVVADEDDDGNAATKGNGAVKDVPGISALDVATDAFSELPEDRQSYCRREALKLIAMIEGGTDSGEYVLKQKYDTEVELGIWHVLRDRSDIRNKIKKQKIDAEQARKHPAIPLAQQS